MATTQQFHATGLTCGHCAAAVTEELTALDGVADVGVEVVVDGTSTVSVTADRPLTRPRSRPRSTRPAATRSCAPDRAPHGDGGPSRP